MDISKPAEILTAMLEVMDHVNLPLDSVWQIVPMAVLEDQVLRIANATTHEMIEECKADVQKSVLAATQLAKGLNICMWINIDLAILDVDKHRFGNT